MLIAFLFVVKYKDIHKDFFILIYLKLIDKEFIAYYKTKLNELLVLLDFFREKPSELLAKLEKLKKKEMNRKLKERKEKAKSLMLSGMSSMISSSSLSAMSSSQGLQLLAIKKIDDAIDTKSLNKLYWKSIIAIFFDFFDSTSDTNNHHFVRNKVETTLTELMKLSTLEKQNSFFFSLSDLINIDCADFYETMHDDIIYSVNFTYVKSDYFAMFSAYCSTVKSINTYQDDKLLKIVTLYQIMQLIDMFTGDTYPIYAAINKSDLLYKVYMEILLLVRPVGSFMNNYLISRVIGNIISQYNLVMILFLIFNFLYESIILFVLKAKIIDSIVAQSKEIIRVAKAMECFA